MNFIVSIISIVLTFFLVFPFLTVLLSLFRKEKIKQKGEYKEFDFGVIITAYKNAGITKGNVKALLKQNYTKFHIYNVLDDCDITDWDIVHEKLTIFSPRPPLKLKVKSIIHAVEHFVRPHDYVIVMDADNLADPDFLKIINEYANAGHRSIQGQRTAKNVDTGYAGADAIGEFYKNYIERYVTYLIGSSAVISGSGMAVESELYKGYLYSPEIEKGKHLWKKMLQEDKILQNYLLRKNEKIAWAKNAIVFDEKVSSGEAVQTQRSRWLYSYFQNLPNSGGLLWRGIKNFSWNQLIFGLVTIAPPLFYSGFFDNDFHCYRLFC